MRTHTLRGRIEEGIVKQLIVDDGRLTHGLRVTKFVVAPEMTASSQGCNAVLGLDDKITASWDWENGNQIAWATSAMGGSSSMENPGFQLVDPNHIVIRDLFLRATVTGSTPGSKLLHRTRSDQRERVRSNRPTNQGGQSIMSEEPIEEVKAPTKTERFAQWLMTREERRAEKESNLESLVRLNVLVSFLTLGLVGGFETVQLAITMIPYLG